MTVIAAWRYTEGKPNEAELTLDGAARPALAKGEFDWVGLAEPTPQELDLVRRQFGLHPLAVEDALNPAQMPKVEIYGGQLFNARRFLSGCRHCARAAGLPSAGSISTPPA